MFSGIVGFVCLVFLVLLKVFLDKFVFKGNRRKKQSFKTGLKTLFISFQIMAQMPSTVPAIVLPSNYKESLKTIQFVNFDFVNFAHVGCVVDWWNMNYNILSLTSIPILLCLLLSCIGLTPAVVPITFLVLPTATTAIFKVFACDELDDGLSYLHADYSVRCGTPGHKAWEAYGYAMILVYPVGVLGAYAALLWRNREVIKGRDYPDVNEVDGGGGKQDGGDEGAAGSIKFLYDSYKPAFWWFEIFETARRLAMTGLLSAIAPGTDLQLGAGIVMSVLSVGVYAGLKPFCEGKDNALAVVTSGEIFLALLTALIMKHNKGKDEGRQEEGVGALLILLMCGCVIFMLGAVFMEVAIDIDGKASENRLALGALRAGMTSKGGGGGSKSWFGLSSKKRMGVSGSSKTDGSNQPEPTMGGVYGQESSGAIGASIEMTDNPLSKSPPRPPTVWYEYEDEGSGSKYYESSLEGKVQWELPEGNVRIIKDSEA